MVKKRLVPSEKGRTTFWQREQTERYAALWLIAGVGGCAIGRFCRRSAVPSDLGLKGSAYQV
jgi:hypothetical protein